jgi:hypothetical protein
VVIDVEYINIFLGGSIEMGKSWRMAKKCDWKIIR